MTIYFCWKCRTKDHWADEGCKVKEGGLLDGLEIRFRKVGRPKVYPDRKTQMREYMRRYRAR